MFCQRNCTFLFVGVWCIFQVVLISNVGAVCNVPAANECMAGINSTSFQVKCEMAFDPAKVRTCIGEKVADCETSVRDEKKAIFEEFLALVIPTCFPACAKPADLTVLETAMHNCQLPAAKGLSEVNEKGADMEDYCDEYLEMLRCAWALFVQCPPYMEEHWVEDVGAYNRTMKDTCFQVTPPNQWTSIGVMIGCALIPIAGILVAFIIFFVRRKKFENKGRTSKVLDTRKQSKEKLTRGPGNPVFVTGGGMANPAYGNPDYVTKDSYYSRGEQPRDYVHKESYYSKGDAQRDYASREDYYKKSSLPSDDYDDTADRRESGHRNYSSREEYSRQPTTRRDEYREEFYQTRPGTKKTVTEEFSYPIRQPSKKVVKEEYFTYPIN